MKTIITKVAVAVADIDITPTHLAIAFFAVVAIVAWIIN